MKRFISTLMVTMFAFVVSYSTNVYAKGGDNFQPVYVDSLKVKADGTKGATAHREYRISAGPDRVFVPDSIEFKENSKSGNGKIYAQFDKKKYKYKSVVVKIEGGQTYTLKMPSEIVIILHAETGSGTDNYNRGAWLNGYVHAKTLEIE